MKKLALTIAIVLGIGICAYAQGGGLFGYGEVSNEEEECQGSALIGNDQTQETPEGLFSLLRTNFNAPVLPEHNQTQNQDAPLGSGALLLIGFGAAYALKKRKKD